MIQSRNHFAQSNTDNGLTILETLRLAMYKEVNFLLCGRVSGLVMTVSGLMDGVSDASGINIVKMM